MKQINKTYYWIGLLIFFGLILALRFFGLFTEIKAEFFYAISGLWVCLIILPLFGEIEFFGIKLKKEIEELKNDVKSEIQSLKFEFTNTNKQQFFLNYDVPPSDNKIDELEKKLKGENKLQDTGQNKIRFKAEKIDTAGLSEKFNVPEPTIQLFQVRYKLEQALRNAWKKYENLSQYNDRLLSPFQMLNDLNSIQLIDGNFVEMTKWILSTCNMSIHGKMTTKKQRDFVYENSGTIYETLTNIANEK